MELRGKDRRYLRSLGHHLSPVVQIGKDGLTEGVAAALDRALHDHELIKVKLLETAFMERDEAKSSLEECCGGEVVQTIGRILLIYRKNEEEPKIHLPR